MTTQNTIFETGTWRKIIAIIFIFDEGRNKAKNSKQRFFFSGSIVSAIHVRHFSTLLVIGLSD